LFEVIIAARRREPGKRFGPGLKGRGRGFQEDYSLGGVFLRSGDGLGGQV